jgi:hypothetical protein
MPAVPDPVLELQAVNVPTLPIVQLVTPPAAFVE